MSEQFDETETSPLCHFCGKPGASGMAGVGNVPGVAVHADCWLESVRDQ